MNNELDNLIGVLNKELYEKHKDDTALFAKLTQVQSDLGLLFDNRPTCPFLRPHLLTRERYDEISNAAQTIAVAAEILTEVALADDKLLAKFDLTDKELQLVRIDPGYERLCATSRLDTFVAGDSFKFLEYNAETPAGVGDQKPLEHVLESIDSTKDFLENNKHWRPRPHQVLLRTLFHVYREFGGRKGKPNIAIVDWDGVPTEAEFYILKDYFESMGFRTLVVDPGELEYDGDQLHAGSFEIDILYKRILTLEFLEKFDDSHPLWRAYVDGNICMANSFKVKIAHKKMSFAIMTDEEYASIFTPRQLEVMVNHIPWTRKVDESKTTLDGKDIDLVAFIRGNRDKFLLKPNDDYGGKGIVLGWESSQGQWDEAINEALSDSFVVQERVPIEKSVFPTFSDKVSLEELLVGFDPFLFQNDVEGGLVRLSSSSLVNVSQGGGQTALIVLEDI